MKPSITTFLLATLGSTLAFAAPSSPAPTAAAQPGAASCPADLSISAKARTLDIEIAGRAPTRAAYNRIKPVAEHGKAPPAAQYLTAAAALDIVVATEKKDPSIIPAGFRARLLAEPRDGKVRLEAARCEMANPSTLRRALVDIGIAALAGAPKAEVKQLSLKATQRAREVNGGHSACSPCDAGETCDKPRNRCVSPDRKAFKFISANEVTVEDAVVRALMEGLVAGKTGLLDEEEGLSGEAGQLAVMLAIQCGKQVCELRRGTSSTVTPSNPKGLILWDLRDGGYDSDEVDPALLAAQSARAAKEKQCMLATGQKSVSNCKVACAGKPVGSACFSQCQGFCRP